MHHLTYETLKSSGKKTGHIKVDEKVEKNRVFWKETKQWLFPVVSGLIGHPSLRSPVFLLDAFSCLRCLTLLSIISVLTRILPWGVPGPPLLRNRGPVRTLGGQSYKKHAVRRTWAHTPNCLLHEVPTWSNMAEEVFTIRRRSLRCSGTCVGPMKVKATKLKTLTHLISCFLFIQTNRML